MTVTETHDEVRGEVDEVEPAAPAPRRRHSRRRVALGALAALVLAGRFAAALLSYDATDLDGARTRVTSLATPAFAEEYATAFDSSLRAVIGELGAVATATVRSSAGKRTVTGSYLQLELQRVDGRWLVAAATAVSAEDEAFAAEEPASTPDASETSE